MLSINEKGFASNVTHYWLAKEVHVICTCVGSWRPREPGKCFWKVDFGQNGSQIITTWDKNPFIFCTNEVNCDFN